MIVRRSIFLFAAFLAATQVHAQMSQKLSLTPEAPLMGDKIKLEYHPDSTMSATGKPVKAVAYYYDTLYRWTAADVPLDKSYKADLQLPGAAGLVIFKFRSGEISDNFKDSGYIVMLSRPGNQQAPAAYAGYGLLRSTRYGLGVPGYFENYNITDTATSFWLGNEIARFRGASRALANTFIPVLANLAKLSGEDPANSQRIQRAASYMLHLPDATEKEQYQTANAYEVYLNRKDVADSLRVVMLQKDPKGIIAKEKAYKAAASEKDTEKRIALWKQFVKAFPENYEIDNIANIDYSKAYRDIFAVGIATKDSTLLKNYLKDCPFDVLMLAYYKMVEIPYAIWKTMPADTAYMSAGPLMERFEQLKKNKPARYWYYSPDEWQEFCESSLSRNYITHAKILMETGHTKEALALTEKTQAFFNYSVSDLNELQATLLKKTGNKKELLEVLRNSVRMNQASFAIFDMLKKEYNNDKGFDAYLASLKDAKTMELMREHIKSEMISETAAPFDLSEMDKKKVSLASLAGKVVVLDFWATWCAPCKAAMPGMQMAQERFVKDTNVVFFYVDTQEHSADYKANVKKFITDKKYPFRVLFDNGEEAYAAYAKLIHTSGIPFKVVIDGKGVIRFAAVGYMGSPSALADEITTMIELSKQ